MGGMGGMGGMGQTGLMGHMGGRALAGKILTTEYTEHTEREKGRDLTAS
jgi:hypothetical protein